MFKLISLFLINCLIFLPSLAIAQPAVSEYDIPQYDGDQPKSKHWRSSYQSSQPKGKSFSTQSATAATVTTCLDLDYIQSNGVRPEQIIPCDDGFPCIKVLDAQHFEGHISAGHFGQVPNGNLPLITGQLQPNPPTSDLSLPQGDLVCDPDDHWDNRVVREKRKWAHETHFGTSDCDGPCVPDGRVFSCTREQVEAAGAVYDQGCTGDIYNFPSTVANSNNPLLGFLADNKAPSRCMSESRGISSDFRGHFAGGPLIYEIVRQTPNGSRWQTLATSAASELWAEGTGPGMSLRAVSYDTGGKHTLLDPIEIQFWSEPDPPPYDPGPVYQGYYGARVEWGLPPNQQFAVLDAIGDGGHWWGGTMCFDDTPYVPLDTRPVLDCQTAGIDVSEDGVYTGGDVGPWVDGLVCCGCEKSANCEPTIDHPNLPISCVNP
jgi:hypothetical protein